MKKLVFNSKFEENEKLTGRLWDKINIFSDLSRILKIKEISYQSDILSESFNPNYFPYIENIEQFILFVLIFIWNVLLNNKAAYIRKTPPYDIHLIIKVDYKNGLFQYHIYLDDYIFGLVVGIKYGNVTNLIKTLFPISSKMNFSCEVRFFPISRSVFKTEIIS